MNWNWIFRTVWMLCLGVNDMSRKMKDSGVEWIGEMPEDWNVQRVKNAFVRKKTEAHQENPVVLSLARAGVKVRDLSKNEGQIAESYYNYNLVDPGDLLLNPMDLYSGANCSVSNVKGVISQAYINLRAQKGYNSKFYDYYFKTLYSFTEKGYHGVDKGDLVIHGMDAFAGAIGCSDSRGKITPVVHVCETTGNNRYFMYFLRSMAYGNILMDLSNGVRIRSSDYRNFAKLGIFRMCVPPLEEQNLIVEFLDRKVNEIEKIVEKKQIFCQELEAYKKSLIYEYVTGKKEVPEA